MLVPGIRGTYVNGRRLPLQGRGWGFESLRAYHLLFLEQNVVVFGQTEVSCDRARWTDPENLSNLENSSLHAES